MRVLASGAPMSTDQGKTSASQTALTYHAEPRPGKLEIRATKPLANGRDLAKAYSPGVAEASIAIRDDPAAAAKYTARANLVAVVSNGSAVLGLGNIGPLAAKPVMEGKAVLFKKFANIDCFDLELAEKDPERLADLICALEPTFGAINLEDIKAPDCFVVERLCRERMSIPVFHDDQHGTAIVVGAAATNALLLVEKKMEDIKVVSTGGGAAGIACLEMLVQLGVRRENVFLVDLSGLVYEGRTEEMTPQKEAFAQPGGPRGLGEVIEGADLFLGLSGPNVLGKDMVERMADKPIIFALANPKPEIMPEEARAVAPDAIIATGRSDYPNQVNNVLCFPFIFRGALDVGATEINEAMKKACVEAVAALARTASSPDAAAVYQGESLRFGPDYLIPKPFDPRLLGVVAGAAAEAAIESGVATRPVESLEAYREELNHSSIRSGFVMRKVFEAARTTQRKILFAEGEDERVLRAAHVLVEETGDWPILIGRPDVIHSRLEKYGIPMKVGETCELINPADDPRYRASWELYFQIMCRKGVSPDSARAIVRTNTTAMAALAVRQGVADSMICGVFGQYLWHLKYVEQILGSPEKTAIGALSLMILDSGPLFVADTHVHPEPTPEQIADTAEAAARHIRRFGIEPRVAICSHSSFGSLDTEAARRAQAAMRCLESRDCNFMFEGEMTVNAALRWTVRERQMPNSRMQGAANCLIFASADVAANVRNTLRSTVGEGLEVGPILMGFRNEAHVVTPSITARGLLNMAALAGAPVLSYG